MTKPVTNYDFHKTTLRLPRHLYETLVEAGARNGHSMNTEILVRLLQIPTADKVDTVSRQQEELKMLAKEILESVRALR